MFTGNYQKIIITLTITLFLATADPTFAAGGTYNFTNQSGLNTTGSQAGYSDILKNLSPANTSSKVLGIVLSLLGLIFIGLMIYGGLTWMLAEGNEQKAEKAKQIILASIIGLIVVLAAYALTFFIINYFSTNTFS
jgi:cytochrome bd-type quinol oxidase subunit 2